MATEAGAAIAIILAGGRGQRFQAAGGGAFKQAHNLADGERLLMRSCAAYRQAGLRVVCALHPALAGLLAELRQAGIDGLLAEDADLGFGHTLAQAIHQTPSPGGWLVGLADMPWIRADTIARLADALARGARLCAPYHQGRRGHPVGFAAGFGAALAALGGDQGGRDILQSHARQLQQIKVDDPGVLRDVDVPADLDARP